MKLRIVWGGLRMQEQKIPFGYIVYINVVYEQLQFLLSLTFHHIGKLRAFSLPTLASERRRILGEANDRETARRSQPATIRNYQTPHRPQTAGQNYLHKML